MSSKLYSRSGAFVWSPTGIEKKGLIVTDFAQCFDPTASSLSSRIDFLSTSDIFSKSQLAPTVSVETSYKFNELAWSNLKSENHPSGIVAGGTEDGSVIFFDAEKLIQNSKLEVISAKKDHHGHVMTIAASNDGRWMCSGGGSGQLLLWDMTNLASPFTPGVPNFQDQVKQLRWNAKTESIFASISSFRVSCWDMRRHGSPVLEFAEIGQGCDWSSLCWCPSDSSQLIVGSQSNHNSVIQKWDLRFTSTPLKEYRHHNAGTTSIDWNKSDSRLMVSSGCDGQIVIWNQENGEILGGAGSLQGDWIRKVEWNRIDPSQFAVQYFQHPVQISSISTLGVPQEGAEVLATRITDNFIPAWCSAPIIGASVALGGRLVTHWKSYDAISQKYVHNVEVETISNDPSLAADVQEFAQALETKKALAWYIHDHAFKRDITSEDDDLLRLTWLLLVDQLDGRSRNKILMHLGFLEKAETSIEPISTAPTTHQSYRTRSDFTSTGRSSCTDQHDTSSWEEEDVFVSSNIDWSRLDEKCWNLMEYHIKNDHQKAIEVLCNSQKWMAAVQYAIRHDSDLVKIVFEEYNKVHPETDGMTELVKSLCPKQSSSHTDVSSKWDSCVESFPDHKWRTLLGILISTEQSVEELAVTTNKIGNKWMNEGKMLRACVAFAIGGNLESLMVANQQLSIEDRIKQGFALVKANSSISELFEKVLLEYGNFLLKEGLPLAAWKLVRQFESATNQELIELKFITFSAAGGRECTGDESPNNPWVVEQPKVQNMNVNRAVNGRAPPPQPVANNGFKPYSGPYSQTQSQAPPPPTNYNPQQHNPNMAPMPPSSMFYQTPSWDHKPPPTMPNLPPPRATAPVSAGWNDPPPMVNRNVVQQPKPNVVQVSWKPISTPAAPGGMMPHGYSNNNGFYNQHEAIANLANMTQGMRIDRPPSVASTIQSNQTFSPVQTKAPVQLPEYHLAADDEKIVQSIDNLAKWLIESARVSSRLEKATDLRHRIKAELTPKLANNKLTPATHQQMLNIAYFTSAGQFREAQQCLGAMARNSADFVEISSFLPALKSLYALALH